MYYLFFDYEPTHKLWLYGNHKPSITGQDEGIWRRIRLVNFPVQIAEEDKDTKLEGKLEAELEGILSWAIKGCLNWQPGRIRYCSMKNAGISQKTMFHFGTNITLTWKLATRRFVPRRRNQKSN